MRVVIVGAGVIGHAIGYELASRGADVEILDPRGTGRGATGASAGILAPYIEGHFGALLDLGLCSLRKYGPFVDRLAADGGEPVEFGLTGTLQVATDAIRASQLAERAAQLKQRDAAHALLDGEGARDAEPALCRETLGALLIHEHGYVNVPALLTALERSNAALGTTVTAEAVVSIDASGGGVTLETSRPATRLADAVVIAAGSWSGSVRGPAYAPVRPVRGQLVQLRCDTRLLTHIVWGHDCYVVPWHDGTVLVGATVEDVGFDERPTMEGVRGLLERAAAVVPALADAQFVAARAGLRPATPDELPIIGPSSTMPGTYYATGHYRNGVLLAPLTAAAVADMVIDGKTVPELDPASPVRFGL